MRPAVKTIEGQPSWIIRSKHVELAITQLGGHMAPVTFCRDTSSPVQPYYINRPCEKGLKTDEPVLVPLRGDFFCLPFGEGGPCKDGEYRMHGEPAGRKWRLVGGEKSAAVTTLTLAMKTSFPSGRITKRLSLVDGHNVVYAQHTLEGFSGRFPLAHHPTLAMPDQQDSVHVVTSPIAFGMTNPLAPSDPTIGDYYSLDVGKRFRELRRVPTIWRDRPFTDCSVFPARKGFSDLLAVFNKHGVFPGWTTATFEKDGFLWFSLKDPTVLPTVLMWMENFGRHAPTPEKEICCLGLEDVCGFFATGLGASRRSNVLTQEGIPTAVKLSPRTPTIVRHIQGVVKTPQGFRKVQSTTFAPGKVTFTSVTGKKVSADVHHEFLKTGQMGT